MSDLLILNPEDIVNTRYKIRNTEIPSRYFFAPTNTSFNKNGTPNKKMAKFFKERSGNRLGITYVGNVAIDERFRGGEGNALLGDKLKKWQKVSEAIRDSGIVPGIQLGCRYFDKKLFAGGGDKNPVKTISKALSNLDIELLNAMSESFIRAADSAVKAGFEAIQLHGAHGFLLSLLISETYNQRKDRYNAHDFEFLKRIIGSIRENHPETVLDLRVSFIENMQTKETDLKMKRRMTDQLIGSGLDMISISNGMVFNDHKLIYPPHKLENGWFVKEASGFARDYPQFLWNVCGNIKDPLGLGELPPNLTLSFCRALIADPRFVAKHIEGKQDKITHCPGCNYCYKTRIKGEMKCKKRKL